MPITLLQGKKAYNQPDPYLVREQLEFLQEEFRKHGAAFWMRSMMWILKKNPEPDTKQYVPSAQWMRRLVPFKYNRIQYDLERTMGPRNICCKPRQAGYCVDGDAEVVLPNGRVIKYRKLTKNRRVLDEFGQSIPIKKVYIIPDFAHEYKGRAITVLSTAQANGVTVAPNHPWLTQRGMVEAQHLTTSDYLAQPMHKLSTSTMLKPRETGVVAGLKFGGVNIKDCSITVRKSSPEKRSYVEVHTLPRVRAVLHGQRLHGSKTSKWILNALGERYMTDAVFKYGREFLVGLLEGWLVGRGHWLRRSIAVKTSRVVEINIIRQVCLALGVGLPYLDGKTLRFDGDCYDRLHDLLYGGKRVDDGKRHDQYVDGAYTYVRVRKTVKTKCAEFFDIEVDSDSHLYWLPIGLTHNTTFFILRRLLLPAILEPGSGGLLISQTHGYAAQHFRILQRGYRYMGVVDPINHVKNAFAKQLKEHLLHLKYSNRKELIFDQIDSSILVESAEVEEAGQGITLSHLVATEVPRWPGNPEETLANLKEAVAAGGTIDQEGTPNGQGGYFFEEYNRAKRGGKDVEFIAHFHEWFWHDEYRLEPAMGESELDEEERRKKMLFDLDMEQMTWRRKKMVQLRHNFKEKYPEDDVSCWLSLSRMFFDSEIANARTAELSVYKPLSVERNGEIVFFQKPIRGRKYVLGGDPAEGKQINNEESDWSAAKIIDEETGEDCCAYRAKCPPEDFGQDCVELCEYYNNAMAVIERNNHGGTVILAMREAGFGNVYKHREWTKRDRRRMGKNQNQGDAKQWMEFEGWPENVKTRKILMNKAAEFLRHYPEYVWDYDLMSEIATFVYDEKGVPKAMENYHDDRVFAWALAHIGRLVNLGYIDPLTWKTRRYGETEDETESEAA